MNDINIKPETEWTKRGAGIKLCQFRNTENNAAKENYIYIVFRYKEKGSFPTWNVKELGSKTGCARQGRAAFPKVKVRTGHGQIPQLVQVCLSAAHALLNRQQVGGGDEGGARRLGFQLVMAGEGEKILGGGQAGQGLGLLDAM